MKRFAKWYGWALALCTILLGAALIATCLSLHRAGAINDAQQVYAAAQRLRWWAAAYLAAVALGIALRCAYPALEKEKSARLEKSAVRQSPRAVRLALLIAAAGLIVAGMLNGGLRDVLIKAINICTECIGLG